MYPPAAWPLVVLAVALLSTTALAAPRLVVTAPPDGPGLACCPVSVAVGPPEGAARVRLRDEDAAADVPAQLERTADGVRLWWVVDRLAAGATHTYQAEWMAATQETPPIVSCGDPQDGALAVQVAGEPFTTYRYGAGEPRPYWFPLLTAGGIAVTRSYPMVPDVPGETRDHTWHRSLWFTHGLVKDAAHPQGVDFWTEGEQSGRIAHREFGAIEGGDVFGRVQCSSDWIAPDGRRVLSEEREVRVFSVPGARLMDWTIVLRASEGPITLADTKEAAFAVRVATTMDVAQEGGRTPERGGRMESATGGVNEEQIWAQRADWCDYSGPVRGRTVGVALLDHPGNYHHPTFWFARNYGLLAANPFGALGLGAAQAEDAGVSLPAGGVLTLRYLVYVHEGDAAAGRVAQVYAGWADPPEVQVLPGDARPSVPEQ